jgi:hypothetical protein
MNIIHSLFYLKHNVSLTRFCPLLHVEPTKMGPRDTAISAVPLTVFWQHCEIPLACTGHLKTPSPCKKHTPWPESASELHRPSHSRLSAMLMPTYADRRVSRSRRGRSPTALISGFQTASPPPLYNKQNLVFCLLKIRDSPEPCEDSDQNYVNFHNPNFLNISLVESVKKMFGVAIKGTSVMLDVTQYPRILFTR